jgi:hypothetical protein
MAARLRQVGIAGLRQDGQQPKFSRYTGDAQSWTSSAGRLTLRPAQARLGGRGMGLFGRGEERRQQEAEKRRELLGRWRQTALAYDALVRAALERLTHWAFPDSQVEAIDDDTFAYRWQLWHTGADGGKFVDVYVYVGVEDENKPDRPDSFHAVMQLPSRNHKRRSPLTREELDYALRHCISSGDMAE